MDMVGIYCGRDEKKRKYKQVDWDNWIILDIYI